MEETLTLGDLMISQRTPKGQDRHILGHCARTLVLEQFIDEQSIICVNVFYNLLKIYLTI